MALGGFVWGAAPLVGVVLASSWGSLKIITFQNAAASYALGLATASVLARLAPLLLLASNFLGAVSVLVVAALVPQFVVVIVSLRSPLFMSVLALVDSVFVACVRVLDPATPSISLGVVLLVVMLALAWTPSSSLCNDLVAPVPPVIVLAP